MRMRRILMPTYIKESQGIRGKASCRKRVINFTLHPMEIRAGKRKTVITLSIRIEQVHFLLSL